MFLNVLHNLHFSPQNDVYFIMLSFLVGKIFKFYIKSVPKFKCLALRPKDLYG